MSLRMMAIAALGWSAVATAAAADVNAQAFYANALALQEKGMGAMFDKRLKPVMAQMKDAGERARAANLAAKAGGRPIYCPPEGAKRGMTPQQVIKVLGGVPESERRSLSLLEAWKRALSREYPCR